MYNFDYLAKSKQLKSKPIMVKILKAKYKEKTLKNSQKNKKPTKYLQGKRIHKDTSFS